MLQEVDMVHSRDLVRSLIAMDKFDIKINSLRWGNCPMNALDESKPEDVEILSRILTTNELPDNQKFIYKLVYQMNLRQ